MSRHVFSLNFAGVQTANLRQAIVRTFIIGCVAATLATTLIVVEGPMSASAAPASAAHIRRDRRPDRERPVATSQGKGSGTSSTTHSRPRLIRR